MNFTSSVTQKGQTTIPVQIRQLLGIKPNTKVVFEVNDNNEVALKPVTDFFSLKGSIKTNKPFNIDAMEKAVQKAINLKYDKKLD